MRTSTRLILTATIPLLMGVSMGGLLILETHLSERIRTQQAVINHISHSVFELALIGETFHIRETRARTFDQWRRHYRSLGLLLEKTVSPNAQTETSLIRMRQQLKNLSFLFSHMQRIHTETGLSPAQQRASAELLPLLSGQMRAKSYEMLAENRRMAQAIDRHGRKRERMVQHLMYGVAAVLTLASFLLAYWLNVHILKGIAKLHRGTDIIRSGDLTHEIDIRSDDELGALSTDFNRMTERIRNQFNELSAANRELQTFSHATAHNFRTPLRSLNGFSAILLEEHGGRLDETGRSYIHEIQKASREMNQIVDGFLQLTRATSAGIKRRRVDLSQLAESLLESHREANPQRRITWRITPDLITDGDEESLKKVLEILLDNAWKFTAGVPEGQIVFTGETGDDEQLFHVRDNGAGFDMAHARKLFQPFQRLHAITEFPGTSLNLAIAARLINRHGGRIWADGQVGKGAAFHFSLPIKGGG